MRAAFSATKIFKPGPQKTTHKKGKNNPPREKKNPGEKGKFPPPRRTPKFPGGKKTPKELPKIWGPPLKNTPLGETPPNYRKKFKGEQKNIKQANFSPVKTQIPKLKLPPFPLFWEKEGKFKGY